MPTYFPPKKNTQYIFYISLASQASPNTFQSNPTIAAGDFKVSTDGGALGNLGTLPAVTPASSKMVKITLSTSEMNGDNVTLVCSDAAGAEWCDLVVNIQTSARQIEDLAYPTVSGRSIDVSTGGEVGLDWANIGTPSSTVDLSATSVGTATTIGATGLAAIWNRLTSALTTSGSIGKLLVDNIDAAISSRLASASYTAPDNSSITAIKAKTDNLPASPAATSDIPSAATIASTVWDKLTSALSTAGSIGKLLVDNIDATISSRLSSASYTAPDNTSITAIKAKTDNLPSDPADASDIAASFAALNDISVSDILAGVIEGSYTVQDAIRLMLSVLVGKASGGGTTTVTFRDTGDVTDRVSATVDSNGNRTAVTLDPS